mmetsp:Transcript_98369/g.281400  ORF Transcript_98369/g.281400 Transcript_98369/m.281400 type:complete len:213 (-) Transcript_98369:168-806(-)|eukprot:CAMPEP_0119492806 /NCGR_PEP_ID=MMETSP1344-20130328/17242_1 /TAXON_ID=236787 /ORGANISM="Florenciella parvula, Strain CCMP2471" /LENGTH=212 /DNA_ID=CAMNT_0007528173 /DNA_START=112 /DNA_END=750 /DNA_ORIENTATION=+
MVFSFSCRGTALAVTMLASALQSSTVARAVDPSIDEYCANFVPSTAPSDCTNELWGGVFVDMFSPDDTCPDSTRYIEMGYPEDPVAADEDLHVSASDTDDGCTSTWGKKFDPDTSVDPIVTPSIIDPCKGWVSFRSKVPVDDPAYAYAQAGALDFNLTLGSVDGGVKAIRFSGMYFGQGGAWVGDDGSVVQVPASACDNFWNYLGNKLSRAH